MSRHSSPLLAAITALAVVTSACTDDPVEESRQVPLLVFAAASLTDAIDDLEQAYEAIHPEVDIRINFAASSALREQILQGAPADVFASASELTMAAVVDAGMTAGDPVSFARNTLALAVPRGNPGDVTGLGDLADPNRLIGLCAEPVPCGVIAVETLARAGVVASIDTYEPNVRSLLTKIEEAELDAGLVYATDIASSGLVEALEIPPEWLVETSYPIARLQGSTAIEAADAFVAFVLSPEGQSILADHGFLGP